MANSLKRLVVAVSGGRSSGMMAYHIHTSKKYQEYDKLYMFCNTGQEKEETLVFLENMKKYWGLPLVYVEGVYTLKKWKGVKFREVSFSELDRESNVFRAAIAETQKHKNRGMPHQFQPYCSGYMKTRVAKAFARKYFRYNEYVTALGMRLEDMPRRVTWVQVRNIYDDKIYPLLSDFNNGASQKEVLDFWRSQPFDLGIDSSLGNCELCWKKSDKNLVKALRYGVKPASIQFYKDMEKKYGNRSFRGNRSITDIQKLAESNSDINLFSNLGDACFCS